MFSLLFGAFYRRKATAEEGDAMWSSFTFLFVNLPRGRQRSRGGGLWKCVAARSYRGWSVGRCYRRSCGRSTRLAQARLRFFPVSSWVLGWLLRCVACRLVLFGCFYSQRGKSSGKNIFSAQFFCCCPVNTLKAVCHVLAIRNHPKSTVLFKFFALSYFAGKKSHV